MSNSSTPTLHLKVIFVGDYTLGKETHLSAIARGGASPLSIPHQWDPLTTTILFDACHDPAQGLSTTEHHNDGTSMEKGTVSVKLYDFSPYPDPDRLGYLWYPGSDAIAICFDVGERAEFQRVATKVCKRP
jgi:hypothetical protein